MNASPSAQGSETLPERLAREACRKVYVNPENEPAYAIAVEAARAALDEAVRVTLRSRATADMDAEDYRESIAAAIEALK